MSTPPSERRRLERELAGLLLELGDLRDQLESSPAGLLGHFRRRRLARQLAGLPYERATNALGSSSGWGLVSRCRPAPAGLRLEDVPRPSLGQILRRNRLDAKIRRALGRVLRRRRPKD